MIHDNTYNILCPYHIFNISLIIKIKFDSIKIKNDSFIYIKYILLLKHIYNI